MLISDADKKELESLVEKMQQLGIKRIERNGFCIELQSTDWTPANIPTTVGGPSSHWVKK